MARQAAARSLRPRKSNRRSSANALNKNRHLSVQALERRELLVGELGPQLISVSANSGENFRLTQSNVLMQSPTQLTFRFDGSQTIDPATLSAITIQRSGGDASFGEGNEIRITPGFLGFGDSQRIVIARFAEALPDDQYRISIAGYDDTNNGIVGLRNTNGELFQALRPASATNPVQLVNFQVEIGPQVVAVVPQPITGFGSARVQQRSQIQVYFNSDPLSNPALGTIVTTNSTTDPTVVQTRFYSLFFTNNTVENTDDGTIHPTSVSYDPSLNVATLEFSTDLALLPQAVAAGGSATYRLRVGSSQALPAAPTRVAETGDTGNLFSAARNLNTTFNTATSSLVVSGQIEPTLNNPIQWPGFNSPGVRDNRLDAEITGAPDTTNGINRYFYNFAQVYGTVTSSGIQNNAITEPQRQRVREVLSLYASHLGVEFIETADRGLQIARGVLRSLVDTAISGGGLPLSDYRINDADVTRGLLILDASEDWYDGYGLSPDPAKPSFFVESLRGIGSLLGLGSTYEQVPGVASGSDPALYNASLFPTEGAIPGFSIEPDFLSASDIIPGQALHRPETRDVDLYRFDVAAAGKISIESFAQRLDDTSSLNSDLKLWKFNTVTSHYDLVARNDDFYSLDSFIGVDVTPNVNNSPAQYVIGITASGNDDYDPSIANSGSGGRSQGTYQLRVTFQNTNATTIRDTDGSALDGDGDGIQGGDFNFWFRTAKTKNTALANESRTLFVDKSGVNAVAGGTLAAPYRSIDYAFTQARPGDIVRVLPSTGSDNLLGTALNNSAYEIGRGGSLNSILSDGETFNVPRGVTVMVDAGSIIKLRNAKISVGSERTDEDRSLAALQILGVPILVDSNGTRTSGQVQITSYNDETLGVDTNSIPTSPVAGDWAGIEFRHDFDYSEGRPVWETEGVFIDYVSNANIRYGGGSITSNDPIVNPLQMLEARPTLIYNTIRDSRDAALSADPNSFLETNFHAPIFQRTASFTSDYDRVGPDIRGNTLTGNSNNGLAVRVNTPAGGQRQPQRVSGRFDDRDVVHTISEVLVLQGQPGGSVLLEQRPTVLNVTSTASAGGTVPVGTINYRVTFINSDGSESLASLPTTSVTVAANQQVSLANLPAAQPQFVGRRLYRLSPTTGNYVFVAQLDRRTQTYVDTGVTRGGLLRFAAIPQPAGVTLTSPAGASTGSLTAGSSVSYRFSFVTAAGLESPVGSATSAVVVNNSRTVNLGQLPAVPAEFSGLRIYRSSGTDFLRVAQLATGTTSFTDTGTSTGILLSTVATGTVGNEKLLPRYDARLSIDPGLVIKLNSARIEATFGADFYAEGTDGNPVVFTSRLDDTYGAGGTFDTGNDGSASTPTPGLWGGLVFRQGSTASLDYNVIRFAGGSSATSVGDRTFNPVEILQADVRIAHSLFSNNAAGGTTSYDTRDSIGFNGPATIFVRGAQPIIVDNIIRDNGGAAISINPDALNYLEINDAGRSTGAIDLYVGDNDNQGPLIAGNRLDNNTINGLFVRDESLTTESVWDDTDIVHVVQGQVYTWNYHHRSGLRLKSDPNQSLVVKSQSGGSLNAERARNDTEDSIGGTIQVLGQPGFPVVLTSINDCEVGAGFTPDGLPQNDTIESGACAGVIAGTTVPFVDVIVVIDESGSLGSIQAFTAQFIADLDAGFLAAGVGTVGGNQYGAVGFGNGINATDNLGRTILVGGGMFGTAAQYVAATSTFVTSGVSEDAYSGINYALDNYQFRPNAAKFIVLATDEPRQNLNTNVTLASTIARLQAESISVVGILAANIVDNGGAQALAIDNTTVYVQTANGFTSSPGGQVTGGFAAADHVPLVTATNGITGDLFAIGLSPATAQTFSTVLTQSLVSQVGSGNVARAGDWQGIVISPGANDRNVAFIPENEQAISTASSFNAIPSTSQMLGSLARAEFASDDVRRSGFNVRGALSENSDLDVYTFFANGGTEVYFDIDDTSFGLDTVVELIDSQGNILAQSNNSDAEANNPSLLVNRLGTNFAAANQAVFPLYKSGAKSVENPNPLDAGFRAVLNGDSARLNQYYVRVRSNNNPNGAPAIPSSSAPGLTHGQYLLSIRLRETDEIAGSTVRLADIRFATNAIDVPSAPSNSPLSGEHAEELTEAGFDLNDNGTAFNGSEITASFTNPDADPLGSLNASNRGVLRVSGFLGNQASLLNASPLTSGILAEGDIDVYRVDIRDDNQNPDIIPENRFVSTIFDIDYADQLGRPNTSLAVYTATGRLILHSRDSNIADDQGRPFRGVDQENLLAGSAGTLDAYIGPVEIQVGTYYVVVSSSQMIPQQLDQLFLANPTEDNVRILPIDSVRNLAEFGFNENAVVVNGTPVTSSELALLNQNAELPVSQPFFDNTSIVPYTLEDVRLFVTLDPGVNGTNQSTLISVNPFTGQLERTIGQFGQPVGDLAIRRDGELFGYSLGPQTGNADNGNTGNFLNISSVNAAANNAGDDGSSFRQSNAAGNGVETANPDNAFLLINALAFVPIDNRGAIATSDVQAPVGNDRVFLVGNRSNNGRGGELSPALANNILYSAVATNGNLTNLGSTNANTDRNFGMNLPLIENFGPGSVNREFGIIDVGQFPNSNPLSSGGNVTGLAQSPTFLGGDQLWAVTDQGGVYSFNSFDLRTEDIDGDGLDFYDRVITTTFYGDVPLDPAHNSFFGSTPQFSSLTFGPRATEGRRYENVLFATTTDGWLYAFTINTSGQLQPAPVLVNGKSAVQITTSFGATLSSSGRSVTGAAFTIREENPWHTTGDRGSPFGLGTANIHGVNLAQDQSRLTTSGGTSLYFGFEPTATVGENTLNDSPNGQLAPGGVQGTTVSRPFSLEGYGAGDKPTLYFNYYLETQDDSDFDPNQGPFRAQTDSFRVFAAGDDGQWRLVSTNDTWRAFSNIPSSDEYDYFGLNGGIPVQETFDNTNVWRQARVDLSPLAGNKNVQLRFDFSTFGSTQGALNGYITEIQAVPGREVVNGSNFFLINNNDFSFANFEFSRGAAINIPDGANIVNGQTITIVRPTGATLTLTLTTGSTAPATFVGFTRLDSGAQIAAAIALRLQTLAPELNATSVLGQLLAPDANSFSLTPARFGHAAVTIPANLASLNGQSLTFTNLVGVSTTVFLTDVTAVVPPIPTPAANELQYSTSTDTATTIATRLMNLFNLLDSTIQANSNADQLILVNATSFNLDPVFTLTSANAGRTDSQFLPDVNGNGFNTVPIFYNRAMTSVQVRDAIRQALANGFGDARVSGVSQATIANYPGFGTNRIRVYDSSPFDVDSGLGFSTFLPGDEFGLLRSTSFNALAGNNGQNPNRGAQVNDIEGVYIDDIVVGFAERGEAVYNATPNRNFVALPEQRTFPFVDTQQPEFPNEILTGGYTLEIRQGAEYGVPEHYDPIRLGLNEQASLGRSFDTNDRLLDGAVTLIVPSAATLLDGDTFVLSNGSQRLTFEFDSNGVFVNGRVQVPFTPLRTGTAFDRGVDDNDLLATAIRDAINSDQAVSVLGILAAGRDSNEGSPVSGNRLDLFAADTQINPLTGERVRLSSTDIQVNPSSGRFVKLDLVGAETPYGRESRRTIPIPDQVARTVINQLQPTDTFARAAVATGYTNGNTDTLVAVGKIGDSVGIGPSNELIGSTPGSDVDWVKIFLRAGNRIDLDIDTTGFALGNPLAIPRVRVFDENGARAGVALSDSGAVAVTGGGEFAAGAQILAFTAAVDGYYYVQVTSANGIGFGDYQLSIRPSVAVGAPAFRDVLMTDYHFDKGDTNVYRDQGQFIIESNFITNFATTGIRATATGGGPNNSIDNDANFSSTPLDRRPGSAALLSNANAARLLPGTVISNNVVVSNGGTGILFAGEVAVGGDSPAPVPYGRIVNNTVVGSGGGTGINVTTGTSPTVLNNIISGFNTGLNVAATSSTTIEAGNAYQGNGTDSNITLAASSIIITAGTALFQDAANGLYIPAAGSRVVDSSFDSFADRSTFFDSVKSPLGIAVSPIIAPSFDAYGIPRFDDPTIATPSGVGANTAIDRGAIDRADSTRPRAVLVAPRDFILGEGVQVALGDTDPDASFVRLPLGSPGVAFFEVQLLDQAGSGPDARTITSQSVLLTEDGVRLVQGVDYTFGYSDNSRLIRLTPTAGLWRLDSVYEITLNNQNRVRLELPTGDAINDGDRYIVTDSSGTTGNRSVFEFDSGYVLQVPQTLGLQINGANNAFRDQDTFTITAPDGTTRIFEINLVGAVTSGNIEINLKPSGVAGALANPPGTVEDVRNIILAALSDPLVATALDIRPRAIGTNSLQIGSLQGHVLTGSVNGLTQFGVANGVDAGEQFRYQAGPDNILFEFVNGANVPVDPTAVAITIERTSSNDEIAAAIATTLVAQPLGLAGARSIGDGRVLVGGAAADVLTLVNTQLTRIGAPGVTGPLTLTVPANATAASLQGRTFTIQVGTQTESFVFTTNPALVTTARRVILNVASTPAQIASAMVTEIAAGFPGALAPSSVGSVVRLGEQSAIIPSGTVQVLASVNVGGSTLLAAGVSGGAIAVPFIPTSLFSEAAAAATLNTAISRSPLVSVVSTPGGGTLLFSNTRQIDFQPVGSAAAIAGIALPAITDLAGNPVASNRDNGETRFTIIMPEVQFDFGDAPNSYGTLFNANGARHSVSSSASPRLGRVIDTELDGQPTPTSTGDDAVAGISASAPGGSPLFAFASPASGALNITIVDVTPISGTRLRVTVNGVATTFELVATGIAPLIGNVPVALLSGDTAETIAARLADAIRLELGSSGSSLTITIDPADPTVIELRTLDDEDGVAIGTFTSSLGTFNVFLAPGAPITTTDPADVVGFLNPQDPLGSNLSVTVTGSGLLDAWIDFNGNGVFDANEQVLTNAPVVDGVNTLRVFTPAGTTDKQTSARFRLSTGGNLRATGVAIGGEVEDYQVQIINIALPIPTNDSFTVLEDNVLDTTIDLSQVSVIANDTIPATTFLPVRFFIGTQPTNGTLVVADPTSGRFVYTPAADFSGIDTFTYRLSTQANAGATAPAGVTFATVTINVRPVNDAPSAVNKTFTTVEEQPITITAANLLANSIADAFPLFPNRIVPTFYPHDESNQLLSLRILSIQAGSTTITAASPAGSYATPRGSVVASFDSTGALINLIYTPRLDLNRDNVSPVGTGPVVDSFGFTVQDNGVLLDPVTGATLPNPVPLTATAVATIDVAPINDAPTANTDFVSVGIVGNTTTVTPWVTYFNNIDPTVPAPVPTEDQALTIPAAFLLANDLAGRTTTIDENSFVSGNDGAVSITAVNPLTAGLLVSLDVNGNVLLTPPADVYGDVVFTYTIVDQGVDENFDINGVLVRTPNPITTTGTVTVTLQPVNDIPVGFDRGLTYTESNSAGSGPAFTFTAAGLVNGIAPELRAVAGSFDPLLGSPFNEVEQILRVVAFRTAAGMVDVNSLFDGSTSVNGVPVTNGTGTLTLASDAGGTFEFDFVNGVFTIGRFTSAPDFNNRFLPPIAPTELLQFLIADDGRTTRPQGGGVVVLPSERAVNFATATITVNQSNDAPVFTSLGSVNVSERDDQGGTVVSPQFATGIFPGPATAQDELRLQTVSFQILTALSTTVPAGLMRLDPQIAPDGTLTVFPAVDAVGQAIYVFEAVDAEIDPATGQNVIGFVERRTRGTVTINVRPVNDAPRINPAVANTGQTQSPDEAWSVDDNGVITFTLKEDNTGPLGVTTPKYIINVRRNPNAIGYERIGLLDVFVAGPPNELDATEGGSQVLRIFDFDRMTTMGGSLRAIVDGTGEVVQLEYTPATDFNTTIGGASIFGLDSFAYEVQDDNPTSGETFNLGTLTLVPDNRRSFGRVQFRLNPVNDPPQFEITAPTISVLEDTGPVSFEDFVTGIFAGPPNSAFDEIDLTTGQRVTFSVTAVSDVAGLFTTSPTIDTTGRLSFTSAPDAYGEAVFEVRATDDGADNATRGDIVSSGLRLITINIRPVNDRPSLNTTSPIVVTLNEDAAVVDSNGVVTNRGTLIPLRGSNGQVGLLDVFNVGPANEAANITPGGNQSITLATPIPSGTLNGTLTQELDALGNLIGLRYTPRANFNGTDSFVFGVTDNGTSVDLAGNVSADPRSGFTTVSLEVIARNDAPIFGGAPSVTVLEDATTTSSLGLTIIPNWATNIQAGPAGASDELDPVTGQTVLFTVTDAAANPANLFLVQPRVSPTGTLTFTTLPNANGSAVFTVIASDNGSGTAPLEFNTSNPPRTFTISVTAVNDPPSFTAGADVSVEEDSGQFSSPNPYATNISPGPADEVASGQTVRFEVTTPSDSTSLFAANGLPTITDNGFLRFTPADNVSGSVVVSVVAVDSEGGRSVPVSLLITIGEVNDVPIAVSDSFDGNEDTLLTLTTAQLLANDIDPDVITNPNETLTIIGLPSTSLNGAAIRVGANGDIVYDPTEATLLQILAPGQTRSDTFTYRVRDSVGRTSNQATVTIRVAGVNDAPILLPDNATLVPGGQTIIRPLDNDIDIDGTINPASLQITVQPAFGSVEIDANGVLIYTPFENFRGQDTIAYTVADNLGAVSQEQTITIDINQAPIAVNDTTGTFRDETININVAANDSDPENALDLNSIQIITPPSRGTATVAGNGIVRFLPEPGFTGNDSFEYTISDLGGRASNVARVSIQTVGSRLQNPRNFTDVNDSGVTSPLDALLIINFLTRASRNGQGIAVPVLPTDRGPDFLDTDGNLVITANDALRVINQLVRDARRGRSGSEGELVAAPSIQTAPLTAASIADSVVANFDDKDYQVDFSTPGDDVVATIALGLDDDDSKLQRESEHVAAIDAAWADLED